MSDHSPLTGLHRVQVRRQTCGHNAAGIFSARRSSCSSTVWPFGSIEFGDEDVLGVVGQGHAHVEVAHTVRDVEPVGVGRGQGAATVATGEDATERPAVTAERHRRAHRHRHRRRAVGTRDDDGLAGVARDVRTRERELCDSRSCPVRSSSWTGRCSLPAT